MLGSNTVEALEIFKQFSLQSRSIGEEGPNVHNPCISLERGWVECSDHCLCLEITADS